MQLETVKSRAIHAIGYDAELQLLEVIFNTGRIYQYTGVPREQYEALQNAESMGTLFNERIRDRYPYWSLHLPRHVNRRRKRGMS